MKTLTVAKIRELIKQNFKDQPDKKLLELAMILASSETIKLNKQKIVDIVNDNLDGVIPSEEREVLINLINN